MKGKKILSPCYDNTSYIGIEDKMVLGAQICPRGKIYTSKSQEPDIVGYIQEFNELGHEEIVNEFIKDINLSRVEDCIYSFEMSEKRRDAFFNLVKSNVEKAKNEIKLRFHNELMKGLETKKTRKLVGVLERNKNDYTFEYDKKYFYSEDPIQIGPGLSLAKRKHRSKELFDIFLDRIPSRKNSAYEDYCKQVGIDINEDDEMLLLATLGAKGPSSFIIERETQGDFTGKSLKEFRKKLELSMRDFSELFDISLSSIQKIENEQVSGKEVLKRIEIYSKFPDVAIFEAKRNKKGVHSDCFRKVIEKFKTKSSKG